QRTDIHGMRSAKEAFTDGGEPRPFSDSTVPQAVEDGATRVANHDDAYVGVLLCRPDQQTVGVIHEREVTNHDGGALASRQASARCSRDRPVNTSQASMSEDRRCGFGRWAPRQIDITNHR